GSAVGTLEAFARGPPLTGPWRENPVMSCAGAAAVRWAARPARPGPVVPPDPRPCSPHAGPTVKTLTYGSWPSPLTAELLATGGTQLGAPRLVGDAVWWTEGIATEGGRQAIVRTAGPVPRATAGGSADGDDPAPAETVTVLPAPYNARSRVHEYGGACWTGGPAPPSQIGRADGRGDEST